VPRSGADGMVDCDLLELNIHTAIHS